MQIVGVIYRFDFNEGNFIVLGSYDIYFSISFGCIVGAYYLVSIVLVVLSSYGFSLFA
jgi:hypothetical protein